MGIRENIDKLNERTKKGNILVGITIVSIIVFIVLFVALWKINDNRSKNSSYLFEEVFSDLKEFDDLNTVSKIEMKDDLIKGFDDVVASYPGTTAAKRALFYKGHVYYYTGNYKEAEEVFGYFTEKYKKFYLSAKAYYFLSYAKYQQGKVDEAITVLKVFEDKLKDSYYTPLAYYRMGNLFEEKKEKENALQYYEKIVSEYSSSSQKEKAELKLIMLKNDITL